MAVNRLLVDHRLSVVKPLHNNGRKNGGECDNQHHTGVDLVTEDISLSPKLCEYESDFASGYHRHADHVAAKAVLFNKE